MKRAFIIMGLCALVAIAATSCKKEAQTTSSFKATLTQPTSDAKTHLGSDNYLYWNEGDAIKVFDAEGNAYIFTTTDNDTTATFTGTDPIEVNGNYTAYYPAANAEKQGDEILLTLPATQTYAEGTFGNATYPMAALYNATTGFTFGSPCGLLAIPVKGTGNISSIELTSRTANEVLAGQLRYNLSGDYQNLVGTETTVTLNCGGLSLSSTATTFYFVLPAGVFTNGFTAVLKNIMGGELGTLSTTNNNRIEAQTIRLMDPVTVGQTGMVITVDATETSASATPNGCTLYGTVTYDPGVVLDEVGFYYGTAAKGLNELPANLTNKVTLENVPASGASFSHTLTGLTENTAYQYCVYVKTGEQEIYGSVENFSTPVFNPLATPLTLEAVADGTITFSNGGDNPVTYRINGGAEQTTSLYTEVNIPVVAGDKVAFYGDNSSYNGSLFTCTSDCYIYGNIMSLVKSTTFPTHVNLYADNALSYMFENNTHIINHPTKDLVMPATGLGDMCYTEMFKGCTGLTRAPELPATTVANRCYSGMFEGCTGLTTAPVLAATKLKHESYRSMFSGCSNLNSVTCLATDINALDCTTNWLNGVAASGTFYADPTATWPTGTNGIPTGWTRKNPDGSDWVEPVTLSTPLTLEALTGGNIQVNMGSGTLETGMKYSVNNDTKVTIYETTDIPVNAGDKVQFYGNGTSTSAYGDFPEVKLQGSAQTKVYGNIMSLIDEDNYASCTTLPNKNYVFYGLFYENTNLTDASGLLLPATTLAPYCYTSMFYGCTSLQTAPELLPATELAPNCYSYMFYYCTSLTTVPALPATTLANNCYSFMFQDCKGLQTVPSDLLSTTTLAYSCYSCMFQDCTGLTTAPELPATTLAQYCYNRMFNGCSNLTSAPELPAPTLVKNCYSEMFQDCSHLNSITCLATSGLNANSSTKHWVDGVASTGTFYKNASASVGTGIGDWHTGNDGIPSDWTVVSQ